MSMAPASTGSPMGMIFSMLLITQLSRSSILAGTIPASKILPTFSQAFSTRSKRAITVFLVAGRGMSFRTASTITPRVPSDPVTRRARS